MADNFQPIRRPVTNGGLCTVGGGLSNTNGTERCGICHLVPIEEGCSAMCRVPATEGGWRGEGGAQRVPQFGGRVKPTLNDCTNLTRPAWQLCEQWNRNYRAVSVAVSSDRCETDRWPPLDRRNPQWPMSGHWSTRRHKGQAVINALLLYRYPNTEIVTPLLRFETEMTCRSAMNEHGMKIACLAFLVILAWSELLVRFVIQADNLYESFASGKPY